MKKHSYLYIKTYIEKNSYKLYSKKYINNATKLKIGCPEGHIFEMGFSGFKGGCRCPTCMIEKNSEKQRYTIINIKDYINRYGYICISNEYKNAHGKLRIKCKLGHEFSMRWDCFQQGQRCPICAGNKKKTLKEIQDKAKEFNHKCLSTEYINSSQKLRFICKYGHIFESGWDHFKNNGRCSICSNIELSIRMLGSNNPMWKGGITNEQYCEIWSNVEFKEFIKIRDNYKCLNPYCYSKNKSKLKLVVHHINYVKKDCDQYNLITICVSCNSRANKDREWHRAWYDAIIFNRYIRNKIKM